MASKPRKKLILNIFTEKENISWLSYLTEEFCRIEKAKFKIEIHESKNFKENSCPFFNYLKNGESLIFQCNKKECVFSKNDRMVVFEKLLILPYSFNKNYKIPFDLFWNAFYLLSRKHEFELSKKNIKVRSYSFNCNVPSNFDWKIPHVNIYFSYFKKYIKEFFPSLEFEVGSKSKITLSHDLDYLKKTIPLRIKQSAFNLINIYRRPSTTSFYDFLKFLLSNSIYWNFDYWQNLESSFDMKSIFYIYAYTKKTPFTYLMDPSYNILKNKKLQIKLKTLKSEGWEIGLHGSLLSHVNEDLLYKEKNILEESLGIPITKTRQHWLCYKEDVTPSIHSKLFKEDASVGWNDQMGFRAGIASPYYPYDHEHEKPYNHLIIPQPLMDSHIYDYAKENEIIALAEASEIISLVKDFDNLNFGISWHPRTSHPEYGWNNGYEILIKKYSSKVKFD